eukprot:4172952-Ditylum_brightwellii.AAC.1
MTKDKDNNITITQPALIETILKIPKLENNSKQHDTPAISLPLQPCKEEQKFDESWDHRSAIGLLTYLARNTHPDIEYAVHMCACYQSDPRKPHGNAIKRIGCYILKINMQTLPAPTTAPTMKTQTESGHALAASSCSQTVQ